MTRAEKIAQLGSFWAFEVVRESGLDADRAGGARRGRHRPDHPPRRARRTCDPVEVAAAANAIQRYLVEETRLGIPAIIHEECLHGLIAWAAPCFQQSIGAAASFDPDVVVGDGRDDPAADAADRRPPRARAGPRHRPRPALGPDRGDLRRGPVPRGRARLRLRRGAPGARPRRRRHRDRQAHGRPRAGRGRPQPGAGPHRARASCATSSCSRSRRRSGRPGIASVMPAYCDVDGVPCHASTELLTDILRDEWGFDGIVASDYIGVEMIATAHRLTGDLGEAARLALVAGVDAELPRTVAFGAPLEAALDDGRVATATARRGRRARAADEVPARAVRASRTSTIPDEATLDALAADEARAARDARRAVAGAGRERRGPAARRRAPPGRGHRADRRQRPRPARRLQPPRPHGDAARDARRAWTRSGSSATATSSSPATSWPGGGRSSTPSATRSPAPRSATPAGPGSRDGTDEELAAAVEAARARRRRDRRPRRALRPDRRLDDRRVPRPLDPRLPRPPAGAARGGRRDRDTPVVLVVVSGRPLAIEWAAGHCARDPPRVGARRRRPGRDRRRADRGREPRAASSRSRSRGTSGRCRSPTGTTRPAATRSRRATTSTGRSSRCGRSGSACPTRRSRSTGLRVDRTRSRPTGGELDDQRRRRRTPATAPATRSSSCTSATTRRPSPGRSSSCAASAACHLAAGRVPDVSRSASPPSSSPTSARTTGASSSRARSGSRVGTSSVDLPLTATVTLVGPTIELRERHRYLTETVLG